MRLVRPLIVLVLLVAAGAVLIRVFDPFGQTVLLQGVHAAPLAGEDDALVVFMTIENRGGPDRLIAATAPDADSTELYAPESDNGLAIPGNASPLLAADGAHVVLRGIEGPLDDGRLFPVTLQFERAGKVASKARLAAPLTAGAVSERGLFGFGDICRVGEGEPAPAIALRTEPLPDSGGWRIIVDAQEFTFDQENAGKVHVPGVGHGHLYVGGLKLGRLYAPVKEIGPLPPGNHTVRVTLNTNDHRAYVVDDEPVTAQTTIVVQ